MKRQIHYLVPISFLILLIVVEMAFILRFNDGNFVYTLDDPYIHMALAENMVKGHYGVNTGEFSAPASSIIWPLILAPLSFSKFSPFILNMIAGLLTVYFFTRLLVLLSGGKPDRSMRLLITFLVSILILAANTVGLIFTGMEHSLQVLSVVIIAYGLLLESKRGTLENWVIYAVIAAPLIRYESVAVSAAAVVYLLLRGHFIRAGLASILLAAILGAFSLFLSQLGLELLPDSVNVKSSVVREGGKIMSLAANAQTSLYTRQGMVLFGAVILLLVSVFVSKEKVKNQLAIISIGAAVMHFMAGRFGSYNRYEIYLWVFVVLINLYIWYPHITKIYSKKNPSSALAAVLLTGITLFAVKPYAAGLVTIPAASNNIYEQHYQMHRFAVDFYKKPVAVNDLGYVSYKNPEYVLDLWGLASSKALALRLSSENDNWMGKLCSEHNAGMILIYENWFRTIPKDWLKMGEMLISRKKITPAENKVSFYAADHDAYSNAVDKLELFASTLPENVVFKFEQIEKKRPANKEIF